RVAELLAPFAADLPPGTVDGYALPVSDGSEANRKGVRAATDLLEQAGWTVQDGVLKNAQGEAMRFDILLANGADDAISAATIYVEALKRLGIAATITTVDSAQLKARSDAYDFDMTYYTRSLSLSPGNEQTLYWGKDGVTKPGTRNLMGMNSPAAEAMIADMLTTTDPAEYTAAVQALDRVLTAGRYVIPLWYSDRARIAHAAALHYPDHVPLYGYWPGVTPDTWWYQE
ncbi:MAG: ABC transporter substrate-binding protein, partial [Rhodobacteraceae bacterium]|nr:ABC transporter substrate-binding protein [Paracoccaceae bacterium]